MSWENENSEVAYLDEQKVDDLKAEVERLQKVVADQALTIGTLKDELGRLNKENDDWHRATRELREVIERLQKALGDEKSLTAATAEHTAQLERKVAELTAAMLWFKRLEGRLLLSYDWYSEYVRENPKPGATT